MRSPNAKLLILARHPESTKNIESRFSSTLGDENITAQGGMQAAALTEILKKILATLQVGPQRCRVICSEALRTRIIGESAGPLLGVRIDVDSGLNAISAGNMAGLKENEAKARAPKFVDELELYRAGVCNSYRLLGYGESISQFEARVQACLEKVVKSNDEVVVIVGHRSSITAALICFARQSLDYSEDFYGYIPLDVGCLSAILLGPNRIEWIGVNVPPEELEKRLSTVPVEAILRSGAAG